MSEVISVTPHFGLASLVEAYQNLSSDRPGIVASESGGELEWLHTARSRDAVRWQKEGLPTRRLERWKYTSLAHLNDSKISLATSETDLSQARVLLNLRPEIGLTEAEIVFFNGNLLLELSKIPAGSCISVLSEILDDCVENGWANERLAKFADFRTHVETSDADRETVFAAMNTSFMQDAVLIHVPAGKVLAQPIVVTYLSSGAKTDLDLPMSCPRVFAHLERGAEASLMEFYVGAAGTTYFANAVSDLRLEENARLSYCKLQLEGDQATHIGTTRIRQKRDSFSESYQFTLGGRLSREDLHISLLGENASAVLDGLYLGRNNQHCDHYTAVEHVVPHTQSDQLYKGVLDGSARAVFNGFVRIHPKAQKSAAGQSNKNLLLSSKAEVDTRPELEIDADDVKAAHGATIGRLDPEHEFYLEARGISKAEAQRMLALGFAQDVALRIQNPAFAIGDADCRGKQVCELLAWGPEWLTLIRLIAFVPTSRF